MPLLSSLAADVMVALARAVTSRRFAPGEVIIQQGTTGTGLYIWESGEAAVLVEGVGEVARKRRSDFAGEVSLLREVKTNATVVAVSACKCLVISRANFRKYVLDAMGTLPRVELLLSQVRASAGPCRAQWACHVLEPGPATCLNTLRQRRHRLLMTLQRPPVRDPLSPRPGRCPSSPTSSPRSAS